MSKVCTKTPIVRLGEIAKIVSGGTPARAKPAFWGGDIPWVKTANIRNGRIGAVEIDERITDAGLKGSSARVVPAGTILMAMYGQGGTRGRVTILETDAAINQACAAIVLREDVDSDFVFQALRCQYAEIRRLSNTGSQENLSADIVRMIKLPLPGLNEQQRIASILATSDATTRTCESVLHAKKRRFEWFRRKTIDSRCEGWPQARFRELFKIVSERVQPGDDLLAVTQDRGVVPRSTLDRRISASAASAAAYKRIRPGDFAVSLRSFEGGLEYSACVGGISAAYTVLRPIETSDPAFYRFFFKSDVFIRRYLAESVVGIRDGKQIDMPGMLMTRIPLPPLTEQRRVGELLATAEHEIALQEEQLAGLQQEATWMREVLL